MKYIYLDQNKWIELAKGIKNKEENYIVLYHHLIEMVQKHMCVFPISIIHFMETYKRKKKESRDSVLRLMYELSNGFTICNHLVTEEYEIKSWFETGYVDCSILREQVIQRNWANVLNLLDKNKIASFNVSSMKQLERRGVVNDS